MSTKTKTNTRTLTCISIMAALSFALMFVSFSVPFAPSFLKMDVSDLPALITAFAFGPVPGASVCILKNLLHLTVTDTMGVGELSNALLGCAFTIPAGWMYQRVKTRKGALIGALTGSVLMALASLPINLFLVYPMYINVMGLPLEAIMGMYNVIVFFQKITKLWEALLYCNVPFTFIKGMLDVAITFMIYKKIAPILKGQR